MVPIEVGLNIAALELLLENLGHVQTEEHANGAAAKAMVPIEVGLNIAALDLPKAQRGLNHIRVNVDNTMEPAAATKKVTMSGGLIIVSRIK